MAQLYHTKGLTFSARPAKYGGGFCVRVAYWKRPARELDKQEVNSTQERWNYEGGGRFDSLEEAQLNIEPFQACVEYIRTEECDRGGGGGGGGASHKKEYAAAVPRPEYTRSGGRNELKAKAAFDQRLKKRPNGAQSEVAKKRKLPDSLQANARARRAKKFAQVLQKVRRRVKELACRRAKVVDWVEWRERAMVYLKAHIWEGTTWKLMDGGPPCIDDFSPHVIQLMQMKALVLHSFLFDMNERDEAELVAERTPGNLEISYQHASEIAARVGTRYGTSGSWVYKVYLEYRGLDCGPATTSTSQLTGRSLQLKRP